MRTEIRSSIILVGILGLAACSAPARWAHPTLPAEQWSLDASTCRAHANRLIEREIGRQGISSDRHVTELERNLHQFDAKKRRTEFFERCLRDKGYAKQKPPEKKSQG